MTLDHKKPSTPTVFKPAMAEHTTLPAASQPSMTQRYPRSAAAFHPNGCSTFGSKFPTPNPAASFIPTTGGNQTDYSAPVTKPTIAPPVGFNEPKLTIDQSLEGAGEGPSLAKEFVSRNGHRAGHNSSGIQERRNSKPGHLGAHGQQFYDERGVLQHANHPSSYYSPQPDMGSGGAPPRVSRGCRPPRVPHNFIHHTNPKANHADPEPGRPIYIGPNPSGKQWVMSTDPLYHEYSRARMAERSAELSAEEQSKIRSCPQNPPASQRLACGQRVHSGNGVQPGHANRKYAAAVPATDQMSASESTGPRKEPSEEELEDIIQNAAKEAVAAVFNRKESRGEPERQLVQTQSSTPDNVDTSSQNKAHLICPEFEPTISQNKSKSVANNSQDSQASGRSHISSSEPEAMKRRRGRPTKEEQKERDRANPKAALLREQAKAAKKAAKHAGKYAAKGMNGKQEVQDIPQGSSTIKIEDELEVEDLYSADAEGPKQVAVKGPSVIIIDQNLEEDLYSSDEGTRTASTKTSMQDGLKPPKKRTALATSRPAAKRRKVPSSPSESQDKSQNSESSIMVVDLENGPQCDGPGSGGNKLEIIRSVNRSPPKPRTPSNIETLFSLEYSREHQIIEIKPNKVYYGSSQVHEVPTRVTHFLTCSSNLEPQRTSGPAQQELCVKPNLFCSLSNEEFLEVFNFIKESLGPDAILLVAPSDGNGSDIHIIEGLAVLVCTMLGKQGVRLPPRSTDTAIKWMGRTFSGGFSETYTELLDDFDFFSHYGWGSKYWPTASKQWKDFIDAVGKTNKRRKAGPNLEYIEVKEFGYTLRKFVGETTKMPLVVPRPFSKSALDALVDKWWQAKKIEDRLSIARIFEGTPRVQPRVVEPVREEWPGTRDPNKLGDWLEALAEFQNMEDLIGEAIGYEDAEDDISLSDEETSWTMPSR
ncbi:hypothetical protein ACEPPN_017796 [Leptodophora sp. 'Broadleaf-Isolate-01']